MPSTASVKAYRVRRCIPLQGEGAARGKALWAPVQSIDDALLLVQEGRIIHLGKYSTKALPAGICAAQVQDLGANTMLPAAINAHTHVQLSHLAGRTLWGQGFVPWLASLIPQLALPFDVPCIEKAVQEMRQAGTAYFADFTSGGMHLVAQAADKAQLSGLLLAEWFGFTEGLSPAPAHAQDSVQRDVYAMLPSRAQRVYADVPAFWQQSMSQSLVPCGHALYSTAAFTLQCLQAWCQSHARPFVLHLAEFAEEVEMLCHGKGALVDLYTPVVLPQDWKAPGCHPVEYASRLGILRENTLAVHCVHCEAQHVRLLEEAQAHVCLCPRSNAHLAVGTAPYNMLLNSHVNICLGTDGLTSNTDLNVWREALFLQSRIDVPFVALLRMLTVNGAAALGVGVHAGGLHGTLAVGAQAQWVLQENIFL